MESIHDSWSDKFELCNMLLVCNQLFQLLNIEIYVILSDVRLNPLTQSF